MRRIPRNRRFLAISLSAALLCGAGSGLLGICGPFTDVSDAGFCRFVLEIFYLGITTGTTPTTYDPASAVTRLQMAAFLSRTVDGVVKRTSRRAILNRFWTQQPQNVFNFIDVGATPALIQSDGTDVWVAVRDSNHVVRHRASDGVFLQIWTGATAASGILALPGTVWITGRQSPAGKLYGLPAWVGGGAVTTVATNLGANPFGIAYDGLRFFTANNGPPGSVSIVSHSPVPPFPVSTVSAGFTSPTGILYDGANIWVTDVNLLKLDSNGAILQTVTVGSSPVFPIFDGSNIWVPNAGSNSVSVVRASNGAVLATLTGNGLSFPASAAFDGERVLVTNPGGSSVSLWKAAGLTPIGSFPIGSSSAPYGACSDGINFWITLAGPGQIVQF